MRRQLVLLSCRVYYQNSFHCILCHHILNTFILACLTGTFVPLLIRLNVKCPLLTVLPAVGVVRVQPILDHKPVRVIIYKVLHTHRPISIVCQDTKDISMVPEVAGLVLVDFGVDLLAVVVLTAAEEDSDSEATHFQVYWD